MTKKTHKKPPQKREPATFVSLALHSADKTGGELLRRRHPWQIYLAAFGVPFVVLFVIWAFSGVVFGNKMILAHDQWHQYYPFILDLQRKLQSGGSLFYSWTNGMGTNYLSMAAYYLASPMNFFLALLPESAALAFYTFTVMVKISLAGLFCAIFLRKIFDRTDFSVVPFSLMYAFCAFICGYYWNAIWLDTVALLPLAALGTIYLLRDGKYVLYTAILALSVFCSYYVGLFTCIFILLLFICYNICYWDDLGGFGYRLVRIAFFSVLGIGMTALLTVPAFLGLQATSSAVNKFPTELSLNISKDKSVLGIIDALRQIISQLGTGIYPTSMEGLPNVACGTVTVVLAIAYFCTKKIPLREKLCCGGLLLLFCASFIFRQLDYIWHGFHFPNMLPYRFSFLFSFVLLFMAYRAFTQLDRWRWYHCLYCAPFVLLLLFCVFTKQSFFVSLLTALLAVITLGALFLYGKKLLSKNLLALLLCVLLLCEGTFSAIRGAQQVGFTAGGETYPRLSEDMQNVLAAAREREENAIDLPRTETTLTQTLNDNALNGYNGISTFSSAANCGVSQFLKSIGLPASVAGNRYSYGETIPLTNTLLGLKYMIDRDNLSVDRPYFKTADSSGAVQLLENTAYLPLGFMVSSDVVEYDADVRISSTRTANVNYLYQLLSGSHSDLLKSCPAPETRNDDGITVTGSGSQYQIVLDEGGSSDAKVYCTYTLTEDCHFCAYTATSNLNNVYISVNGKEIAHFNAKYGYLRDFGNLKAGDVVEYSVKPKADKTGTLTVYAATFDDAAFDALYKDLSSQTMTATTISDTVIEGAVRAEEDGILYLSVPYDKGWTATVDGKNVTAMSLFGAFIGLRLSKGSHEIRLEYETPGFSIGLTVSFICLAVFLLLVVIALLRRVLTRPMQQVDLDMLGAPDDTPDDASDDTPDDAPDDTPDEPTQDEVPDEPAYTEPIPDAPALDQTRVISVSAAEDAPASEQDPSEKAQWSSLLDDVNALLCEVPQSEDPVSTDMPPLFDGEDISK